MASTAEAVQESESNKPFAIEQNGINLIPDSERKGTASELFWVWGAANLVLTFIISGYLLATLGLSPTQMLAVTIAGNLLFLLIGYGGIPGARAGTATLVISRAAFGRRGNVVPSFLSWLTVVGWEAVNLVLGAFALFSLMDILGWPLPTLGKAVALSLLAAFTFGVAILGHATIVVLQRFFTLAFALILIGLIPQVWSAPPLADAAAATSGASFATLCVAFTLVAALPISYGNMPADYTRYLPRTTSGASITFWTFLGSFIPTVVLTILGYFAAKAANLADPVGGFQPLLTPWYFTLFVIVVLGGTITNNFLNTYSSGLSLLAVGLKVSRPMAIVIDAILATTAAAFAIFYHDFTATFIAFLSLMVVWLAPWTAVYVTDIWLRKGQYRGEDLLSDDGGVYRYGSGWHGPGFVAWLAGVAAAVLCTSADMFKSPFATSVLGGADLSIVAGFLVSALLYLTLARRSVRATT